MYNYNIKVIKYPKFSNFYIDMRLLYRPNIYKILGGALLLKIVIFLLKIKNISLFEVVTFLL